MTITAPERYLLVSIGRQTLDLMENGSVVLSYPVSTAKNGPGELNGSGCTPRGWHSIRAKIGGGHLANTVFIGRRPNGELYHEHLASLYPARDWILTRILWLGGLEPGLNRYKQVDTGRRYIYIHGSPNGGVTGQPLSHGCIRMKSPDVIDLFDRVEAGCKVFIQE